MLVVRGIDVREIQVLESVGCCVGVFLKHFVVAFEVTQHGKAETDLTFDANECVRAASPKLADAGVPMALVTNTRRGLTERALDRIGRHYFVATVCADEVPRGKPAPDPYQRAAALLGLEPAQCLAIEDSVAGARAAEDAGCPVLVVPNDFDVPAGPRRYHVTSLAEVDLDRLVAIHHALQLDPEPTA